MSFTPGTSLLGRNGTVTPGWVKSHERSRFVLLETGSVTLAQAKDYLCGHVPKAVYVNTDEFENGYPRWHLKPLDELQQVIGRLGINRDTTVVVYSRQTLAAARVWWILNYAGVSDVRILDGGYSAWLEAGYDGERTINEPQPVPFTATPREHWLATTAYVRGRFDAGSVWLADTRSAAEYHGDTSGYDYLQQRGRIPGALHIQDADDVAHIYQQTSGRLRSSSEIAALWATAGLKAVTSDEQFEREVIFYCGSGWRSSLAFFYAYTLGYTNIRNYSDGWSGWSTTYKQDAAAKDITPGWRQEASGNPIETSDIATRYDRLLNRPRCTVAYHVARSHE